MATSTLTRGHGPVSSAAPFSPPITTDAAGLSARQRLYEEQVPPVDLPAAVSAELPVDVTSIVDVGCGNGAFLRRLRRDRPSARVIGVDISREMLTVADAVAGPGPLVAADAASLPLRERSVDAAIAMHVLYLLADPIAALAALFRLARLGGMVIVGTSDREDKATVRRLIEESTAGLDRLAGREVANLHDRFDLAAAATAMRALTPESRVVHFRASCGSRAHGRWSPTSRASAATARTVR